MNKKILSVVASAAAVAVVSLTPVVAHAEPRPLDCSSQLEVTPPDATSAICKGGAGTVRAVAICGNGLKGYGRWVNIGVRSYAFCLYSSRMGHSYETSYG
ncbi:hypothetical protein [Nonomuraea rhizosphaerae]|uniref:hypothetical protein n=1 Tax=Nonomuraea rhizosphaerae TaxID=2665663 RepID=UPI001C5F662A|nr:hypothetical protein [Nonomuraea rhizosphaerae]